MPTHPNFERRITNEMRAAVHDAGIARGLTHKRIAELAATGELLAGEPFDISWEYVGELVRKERKRREGKAASKLALMGPADSVETLRIRLVNLADSEALHLERAKEGQLDIDRAERLAKLVHAIARIPAVKDERPKRALGSRDENGDRGPETKVGLGGALLKAHRDAGTSVA